MTLPAVCRPSATEQLLLEAALLPPERALSSWQRWAALILADPGAFDDRLLPLVYRNLGVTDPLGNGVKKTLRRSWLRTERLLAEAEPVLRALENDGVPVLALKGLALGLRYYGGSGVRPFGDLDLLVPGSRFAAARRRMQELGWKAFYDEPPERIERFFHAHPFTLGARGQIDLHRHVLWAACYDGADDSFWEASETLEVAGHQLRCLCPADELLHVIVHGVRWYGRPVVRWIADAVLVIRGTPELDWNRYCAQARRMGVVSAARIGVAYLQAEWGAAVPSDVLEQLGRVRLSRSQRAGFESRLHPGFSEDARPSIVPRPHETWPERLGEYLLYLRYDLRRCVGPRPSPSTLSRYFDLLAWRWGFRSRVRVFTYLGSLLTRRGLRTALRRLAPRRWQLSSGGCSRRRPRTESGR